MGNSQKKESHGTPDRETACISSSSAVEASSSPDNGVRHDVVAPFSDTERQSQHEGVPDDARSEIRPSGSSPQSPVFFRVVRPGERPESLTQSCSTIAADAPQVSPSRVPAGDAVVQFDFESPRGPQAPPKPLPLFSGTQHHGVTARVIEHDAGHEVGGASVLSELSIE